MTHIEEEFQIYLFAVHGERAKSLTSNQVEETRRAFYAGAAIVAMRGTIQSKRILVEVDTYFKEIAAKEKRRQRT